MIDAHQCLLNWVNNPRVKETMKKFSISIKDKNEFLSQIDTMMTNFFQIPEELSSYTINEYL